MQEKRIDNLILDSQTKNFSDAQREIRAIEKYGIAALGRQELIDHHQGKRLYASKRIRGYCYGCMSFYADGKGDCGDPLCILYPLMPYRSKHHPVAQLAPLPAKNGHNPVSPYPPQTGNTPNDAGARS